MSDCRFAAFLFCLAALAYGVIAFGAILSGAWVIAAVFAPLALALAFGCRYLVKKDLP